MGKGNTRLVTWEGEKTLTFTVTDALLSPISLSILSGAGLFKGTDSTSLVHMHTTAYASVSSTGKIDLSSALASHKGTDNNVVYDEQIDKTAPIFISIVDDDQDITGELISSATVDEATKQFLTVATTYSGKKVFVDFYITKLSADVNEIQIDATSFGGNFYVEASTLFRSRESGTDMPAEITLPNVKIQSNFTFSMAATGDPSTFDFTMDAMPGYTYFDNTHKVMCVIQVIDDAATAGTTTYASVMSHTDTDTLNGQEKDKDSVPAS